MDKVIIRDLMTDISIGITDAERSIPQKILINLDLYTNTAKAAGTDSIVDCVNYSTMTKNIISLAEKNQRKTVEAFAQDIAELCLSHNLVQSVRVRVEKTGAVQSTKAVGVEIVREK